MACDRTGRAFVMPSRKASKPSEALALTKLAALLARAATTFLRGCLTEKIAGKNRRTLSHDDGTAIAFLPFSRINPRSWSVFAGRDEAEPHQPEFPFIRSGRDCL